MVALVLPASSEEVQKFTKEQARYRESPLIYKCRRCRLFVGDEKKCQIVSELDDPDPGVIEPEAGCDLWNAGPFRQAVRQRRVGRGTVEAS